MSLQSNLTKKEKMLAALIVEKDGTILEQQRIIRRLLRKSLEEEERSTTTLTCHSSDSTLYTLQDYDQGNINNKDCNMTCNNLDRPGYDKCLEWNCTIL